MEKTEQQRLIVSFDIGIKNLACCILRTGTNKASETIDVIDWNIISLAAPKEKIPPVQELSLRLFAELDAMLEKLDSIGHETIDSVLIENQPSRLNGVMKSVQMLIYSYFQLRRHWEGKVKNVHLISAACKLKDHDYVVDVAATEKTGYDLNKWKAIKLAEMYIGEDATLQSRFCSYKKKDDMSDSLLQAIAWLRKQKYNISHVCGDSLCV